MKREQVVRFRPRPGDDAKGVFRYLWSVEDAKTGETLFGPAPWRRCEEWAKPYAKAPGTDHA